MRNSVAILTLGLGIGACRSDLVRKSTSQRGQSMLPTVQKATNLGPSVTP
jgi:hypothetical protein